MKKPVTLKNYENEEAVRDFFWGRQLLFLSVDIVDSTEMKQTTIVPRASEGWKQLIRLTFECHEGIIKLLNVNLNRQDDKEIRLWKTLGDELVFVTEIEDSSEVVDLIFGWRDLLKVCCAETAVPSDGEDGGGLCLDRLRFCAWTILCGDDCQIRPNEGRLKFPSLSSGKIHPTLYDYICPSMDIGFRVASSNTPRRIALSVELAAILAAGILERDGDTSKKKADDTSTKEDDSASKEKNEHRIYCEKKKLKGVLSRQDYYSYWVSVAPRPFEKKETRIMNGRTPRFCIPKRLIAHARAFTCHYPSSLYWPFSVDPSKVSDEGGVVKHFADKSVPFVVPPQKKKVVTENYNTAIRKRWESNLEPQGSAKEYNNLPEI